MESPPVLDRAALEALAFDLRVVLGLETADLAWTLPPREVDSEEALRDLARDLLNRVIGMEVEVG